jgi:dTDP-4-amino-4,6-dideoxygalactose transaminase
MRKIPFLNLKEMNSEFDEGLRETFSHFLESGQYILGEKLLQFEHEYAHFHTVEHCIGVGNGLDALVLSLKVLGIGEGDEVIVPANTYIATWLAVTAVGAIPVPVDPRLETYNLNPDLIEKKITTRTKAILPVHLYGQACEMDAIGAIAKRYGLDIVEDNAQAQGAYFQNQITGSFGKVNATSFYPTKNLGALGDGGAITTEDSDCANHIRMLRNYGSLQKNKHEIIGINSRLDELQAAILSMKLLYLNHQNQQRQAIAAKYFQELGNIPELDLPIIASGASSVFHLFVIRSNKRDGLKRFLATKGIETQIHYPLSPHLQSTYDFLKYKKGDFAISEQIANTCLSLPCNPSMNVDDTHYIIEQIRLFYA